MIKLKFTLIELLVVVAIIGILASILLPSLEKARDKAKTAVCKSNQKQIGLAIQMYANDYDDAIPISGYTWANVLGHEDYLGAPRVDKFDGATVDVDIQTKFNAFYCPSGLADKLSDHAISNHFDFKTFADQQRPWRSGDSKSGFSTTKYAGGFDVWYGVVGSSSKDPDGNWAYPTWRDNLNTDGWPKLLMIQNAETAAAFHDGTHHQHTFKGDKSRISPRHNGRKFTNVAFYDGHVGTFLRTVVMAGTNQGGNSSHPVVFQPVLK